MRVQIKTLDDLRLLVASGEFDHATVRDVGRMFEGLHIYAKADHKIGFDHVGAFLNVDGLADKAYEIVRHTGVSVGARGQG